MFTDRVQRFGRRLAETVVAPLAALGMSPNTLTSIGLLLNGFVGAILASGHLRIGGALLLLAGGFDMLDGALARVTKQLTTFGAFFDSVVDRYAEAAVILGLAYAEYQARDRVAVLLLVVVLTGSFLISYTRARAEGLGLECRVGLLPRPERVLILGAGLLFGVTDAALVLLAVLTNLTAIQRIVHVRGSIASVHATTPDVRPDGVAADSRSTQA